MRKYDLTSSRVGGMNSTSLAAFTPFGSILDNSLSENKPSESGALARTRSPAGEILFSVSVLVLLYAAGFALLFAAGFTPLFAAGFTPLFAAGFGSIFEVKPFGNTHSPSIFSGKQYIGVSFLLEPRLNPIKPFITSLSLPAASVFSVTAISATARGLEREKGFSQPSRLQMSSNRK